MGVKTSVLVWQGVGSVACAKGRNWRGLKAVQYLEWVCTQKCRAASSSHKRFCVTVSPSSVPWPHVPQPPWLLPPWDHPKEELRVAKGDAECAGVLNPTGLMTLIDFGHYQFSSNLCSCFSFPCVYMSPSGHPPSPHHIWSCTSRSLPHWIFLHWEAWMLLSEPCALKHILWLFLTHSSSRAAFSGAMECNVEPGPQETQVRQIYHNLLHSYSFRFWHSLPDSGAKHPLASKDQSKPSLLWFLLMGWEPSHGLIQHFLTLLFLAQTSSQCSEHILKSQKHQITLPPLQLIHPCTHHSWNQHPEQNPHLLARCLAQCFALGLGPAENLLTSSSWKTPFNQNRSLPRDRLKPEITRNLQRIKVNFK